MQQQLDYVLRTVEERGVRFVRLWFTDVLGALKSFAITPAELETALEEGMTFDGSAIEGYSRVQESDMLAMPDPNTFEIVPWRGDDAPVARMFCDIKHLSEEPFEGDPRYVLKRNLDRAREKGFTLYVAPEMEFYIFESPESPKPLDHAGFFDLTQLDMVSELRRQTVVTLEAMGIPVEYSFHELGPSQHEIDLRYTDALTMADNVMTFRLVVKQVAADLGAYATFMPKPIEGVVRIRDALAPVAVRGRRQRVPRPGRRVRAVEGRQVLHRRPAHHAREITAVTNQTVNSYKRLIEGYEAPVYVCWARNNESALVRVPVPKKGKGESSTRIEFRSPDPACNPYLAFSVMLAAGLKGVEQGYELPPEATNNIYEMTPEERAAEGHRLTAAEPRRGHRGHGRIRARRRRTR